jgi:hypothetical protein
MVACWFGVSAKAASESGRRPAGFPRSVFQAFSAAKHFLAPIAQERFTGPEWIFERKFDGIRLLAFHQGNECTPLVSQSSPAELPSGGAGEILGAGMGLSIMFSTSCGSLAAMYRWCRSTSVIPCCRLCPEETPAACSAAFR